MMRFSMKKEMKQLYQAPLPEKKEEFLREFPYPRAGWRETIAVQLSYVRKSVWFASLLSAVSALLLGEKLLWDGTDYDLLWSLSAVMPVLAVLVVTEAFRSGTYGMAELEMAAKHNLSQVLLIRMGAIGTVDFFLIIAGILFVSQSGTVGMLRAAVYLLVPYLCTCVLTLQIEKGRNGRETTWYCGVCGCSICGVSILSRGVQEIIYDRGKFYLWMIVFFVLTLFLIRQIWQIRHKMEEWKWNLYSTE
ncbi:MAG: hypothetical protein HFH48_01125 [Lachnospiraceae bacterium]|nr:hypothetical protein [Lachnospiraceae bacterium]